MRVSHVALDDFRSYRHAVVEFPPGTTVLVGRNGQGKTNLVEAIAYLAAFSSHRVAAEGALVRLPGPGTEEDPPGGAVIRVKLVTGESSISEGEADEESAENPAEVSPTSLVRERVIELEIVRGRANRARLNRTHVRPRDIVGLVRSVVFAPEDLQLVRGEPSGRRQFLDDLATQLRPTLQVVRSDFERVAKQRAALMKQAQARQRRGMVPDLSTVEIWDQQFAALSAELTAARAHILHVISGPASQAYARVADSPKELVVTMDASIDRRGSGGEAGDLCDVSAQTQRLLEVLAQVRSADIERGVNTVGAHRDDITVELGGMPVKGYASHGESWSVALSLRLAAFEVLSVDGEQPILILDDVFAELDSQRRAALAEIVSGADQVIVTAAVAQDVPESLRGHHLVVQAVEEGSVVSSA